jgi:lipid-A-disaccharide synthase-like uncharacterized protein
MTWAWLQDWWHTALDGKGWMVAFGLAAQALFMARFVVQWIASERAGRSVVPMAFWFLSLAGGLMLVIYGVVRAEPVILVGQAPALMIYARNIILARRGRGGAP